MSRLHITEYPNEVTESQLDAAFAALGFDKAKCSRVELRLDGFSATVLAETLTGDFVGWVDIDVPKRPGAKP